MVKASTYEEYECVLKNHVYHCSARRRLSKLFNQLLTDAKLRRVRFHDLRHSFASLLLQQGESLTYVKEQMGHSSINVTVDIYGHLVPGGNRAAVDQLDAEVHVRPKKFRHAHGQWGPNLI